MSDPAPSFLCLASYEKGADFLRELKRQGCRVFLLTTEKLKEADWPRESIDHIYYMADMYDRAAVVKGISYLARQEQFDCIVALDDFDVETAATLREHLRIPGMGDTTARYFRDKLAMRVKAQEHGILVPPFVHVLNHERLRAFMAEVPAPWVLKPRSEASAVGIKKLHQAEELWPVLEALGDKQSFYLMEQFIPGDVYHIDSIICNREVCFAESHRYVTPPFDVAHGGGLFGSATLPRGSDEEGDLRRLNQELVKALGLVRGVTHTEFIRAHADGRYYFLETASRVGGANIAEMVEAATGVNLWHEWATIEINALRGQNSYRVPDHREDYAAVLVSLAKQEWPDTSAYNDPEIFWRMKKRHHVGFVLASPSRERLQQLLDEYMQRCQADFLAVLPAPDKPTS